MPDGETYNVKFDAATTAQGLLDQLGEQGVDAFGVSLNFGGAPLRMDVPLSELGDNPPQSGARLVAVASEQDFGKYATHLSKKGFFKTLL